MSKAPSRAGKPGKVAVKETKGKTVTSEKQPATLFEIVPGKFNENDWNNMLDNDDSQEFIWDIVDEIVESADKMIYKKYIEKQTIPYTINEAKNAILHLIDWYFLPKDNNDEDLTQICIEDEEPEPPVVDSWAQGYIQTYMDEKDDEMVQNEESEEVSGESSKNFLQELSNFIEKQPSETNLNEIKKQADSTDELKLTNLNEVENNSSKIKPQKSLSFRQSTFKSKTYATDLTKSVTYDNEEKPEKRNPRYDRYAFDSDSHREPTKTRSKLIESESKRIENSILKAPPACHSILKSLLSRPAGYRELEIDNDGNVVSIAKVETERLSRFNIKPKVNVIDNPRHDEDKVKLKKKKEIQVKEEIEESQDFKVSDVNKIIEEQEAANSDRQRKQRFKKRGEIDEFDFLLEPAHGVVYKIGKITRTGPRRPGPSYKPSTILEKFENELMPVQRLSASETRITRDVVDQILEKQTIEAENIKPLTKLKPIPPIGSSTEVN